ncbi:MAG: tetratricopeptide repeat protein [Pirellulales bacterium]
MDARWERAFLLYREERWQMAERACRELLAEQPQYFPALWLLSFCLLPQERWEEATEAARLAIMADPEDAIGYYAYAQTMSARNRLEEARQAIQDALRLAPERSGYWALLSQVHYRQEHFTEALDCAQRGLAFDPDDSSCQNLAALAANRLGRTGVAEETLRASLSRDPENAMTHANLGWMQLQAGDAQAAILSFREALRIDPELDNARLGMLESIKAKNFVYRGLLRFNLWMARQSSQARWLVIVVGWMGYRAVRRIGAVVPALAPYSGVLQTLYLVFVLATWLLDPLANLLMRLHPDGKYALSRRQLVQANCVGVLVALALAGLAAYFVRESRAGQILALTAALLIPAVVGALSCEAAKPRLAMWAVTAALFVVGATTTCLLAIAEFAPQWTPSIAASLVPTGFLLLPLVGIGAQIAANVLPGIEERR